MELLLALAVVGGLGSLLALWWWQHEAGKKPSNDPKSRAWALFTAIAEEVGGLSVVEGEHGWPSLRGVIDGAAFEIDHANHIARGMEATLGMRGRLPEAEHAPNAALWVGEIDALRHQFGRPRPSGDAHGLFEVYTRVEPSASDWWQEPELHEALVSLPGAGVLLVDGQLTVVFANLDPESVRQALTIPPLIRRGVQRVTLH